MSDTDLKYDSSNEDSADKEIEEFNTVGSVAPGGMGPAKPLGMRGKGNAMDSIWPWTEKNKK